MDFQKRIISVLMIGILLISMTACGSQIDAEQTGGNTQENAMVENTAFAEQADSGDTESKRGETAMESKMEKLNLTDEWDKTFPKSDKVDHRKVTFLNRFGITLAADMYTPKDAEDKLPALAVCGPFGAVKEQSSGVYAQEMAERGFLTLAVDPAYTGESGGWPRNVASPDICTEDYGTAVDFLSVQDNVDPDRIGIIGICGYGGFALNAAIIDTRVKATVTSTMYDISRMNANGNIGEADSAEARDAIRERLSAQRTADFRNGDYAHDGGVPKEVPDDFPDMVKNAVNYYTTERGYHERSLNSNGGSTITYPLSFINAPLLTYLDELKSAVLLIHGENAHSLFYSQDAYERLKGDNKELLVIPGAVHIDLYDNQAGVIPYDKIEAFFNEYLK